MINLTGKSVFVKTQEEYLSILKIAKLQGFKWPGEKRLNAINIPIPNLLNFYDDIVTYSSDDIPLFEASEIVACKEKIKEAIAHITCGETYFEGEDGYVAADRLAAYEEAEEHGLLMKLPVPLGTTVYTLSTIFDCIYDYDCKSDQKWKCKEDIPCEYEKKSYHIKETEFGFVMAHSIGETVFLTHEEAEKKLEKMKAND